MYRRFQCSIDGVYGKELSINHFEKLTINDNEEVVFKRIKPNFYKGLISTQHLHNIFIINATFQYE